MRHIPRLYLAGYELDSGTELVIENDLRHRLVNVLRVKKEHPVILFNGKTESEAHTKIIDISRKRIVLAVESVELVQRESSLNTCLWQAMEKSDRMDYAIQKSVELGVTAIQPVYTTHSLPPLTAKRLLKKMAHWNAVIIHACEQAGRCILPELREPAKLTSLLTTRDQAYTGLIPDPDAAKPLKDCQIDTEQQIDIVIGPIGGFEQSEVELAEQHGMQSLRMGPRILRTETAGVVVLSWLQAQYGDFASA